MSPCTHTGVFSGTKPLFFVTFIGVAFVVAAVLTRPFDARITEFYEAASLPDAFGRNVVNVILVDFRALDTLGEVAVVLVAAIAAVAALTAGRKSRRGEGGE